MKIKSYLREYEVELEKQIDFTEVFKQYESGLVVADSKVYELYRDNVFKGVDEARLFIVEAREENKTAETALELCMRMTDFPAKRNSVILAVGGGIIQDICTFAANILYRGTRLVLVPTTLLAQTDSCIGSKSSINFGGCKNLLGYFYPPEKIYASFDFLKTLGDADYRSGLGEIFKINVMAGAERAAKLSENLESLLSRDYEALLPFVEHALSFKKALIEADEFDEGQRRILNYGHTFGHAIEAASGYAVPHGLGVVMGALIANEISYQRGFITKEYKEILSKTGKALIPASLAGYHPEPRALAEAVKKDKKRQGNGIAGVLLSSTEELRVFQDITEEELYAAVECAGGGY